VKFDLNNINDGKVGSVTGNFVKDNNQGENFELDDTSKEISSIVELTYFKNLSLDNNIDPKQRKINNGFKLDAKFDTNNVLSKSLDFDSFEASESDISESNNENFFETNSQQSEEW